MRNLNELDKFRNKRAVLLSISFYGGDPAGNGVFIVRTFKSGRRFNVIATDGGGWDHVSVTPLDKPNKIATWDEMCEIKDMFFLPEEEAIEFHPKKSEYVNLAKNCLHLRKNYIPFDKRFGVKALSKIFNVSPQTISALISGQKRYCKKHPIDCAGCALKGKGHCTLHDMPQVWETWDLAERLARAADEVVEKNGKRKA